MEDDTHLALGLQLNLEVEGYLVVTEALAADALARRTSFQPHVVVLDVMLPDASGFEVLRQWRQDDVTTRIIVLSAKAEEADRVLGLRLGADDYVTKPFSLMELLERIRRHLSRTNAEQPGPQSVTIGDARVDFAARTITRADAVSQLSAKEYALLKALVDADGAVVSTKALLTQAWGYKQAVRTNTVQYHISSLRSKLEPNPQKPIHIITVSKAGYRLSR